MDKVKKLGYFIEIENKKKFDDAISAKKDCLEKAKEIGIGNPPEIAIGYVQMLEKN